MFEHTECPKRTDEEFRSRKYDEEFRYRKRGKKYHKYRSPLEDLPIDMIKQFIVGDTLHLLHIGNMKRFLYGWNVGNLGYDTKWSAENITNITKYLKEIRLPKEFKRKVRGLDELSHWKGTEYYAFLNYLSVPVLKDYLPEEFYHHFLLFFCAITICSSTEYQNMLDLAEFFLNTFIESFICMYGVKFITSNVHNLTHVVDEVREFGPLPTFDTYPFECALFQIKRMLRQGRLPLEQAANRITEIMQIKSKLKKQDLLQLQATTRIAIIFKGV